jgi:hypothetical protein
MLSHEFDFKEPFPEKTGTRNALAVAVQFAILEGSTSETIYYYVF